jgi:GNAT superfamily N-acetyltransferase
MQPKPKYLSSKDLGLLKEFYSTLFALNFPDRNERESFQNILNTLKLWETGKYGGNDYHVLVLLERGKIVGGAIFNYFINSNCGVIEFIVVHPKLRGKGYSKTMIENIQKTLAEDANNKGKKLIGIFGEAEIPFLVEEKVINPWIRLQILGNLGFSRVGLNYVQPSLGTNKKPVRHLMLIFKPEYLKEDAIKSKTLNDFLQDYFKWAMRIPAPGKKLASLGMKRVLVNSEKFSLEPLFVYCGMDDDLYYFKEPTDKWDPDINDSLKIYVQSFAHREFAIPTDLFLELIEKKSQGILDYKYHFLMLKRKDNYEIIGFTEFFTLNSAGFGGYVAIRTDYRGKNLFKSIIRKVERIMFEDSIASSSRIRGWFVEFEKPEKTPDPFAQNRLNIMLKEGFRPLKLIYHQPILPGATSTEDIIPDKLYLAYKSFGDSLNYEITREEFLDFLRDLLRYCYYIDNPESHLTFMTVSKQVAGLSRIPFEQFLP